MLPLFLRHLCCVRRTLCSGGSFAIWRPAVVSPERLLFSLPAAACGHFNAILLDRGPLTTSCTSLLSAVPPECSSAPPFIIKNVVSYPDFRLFSPRHASAAKGGGDDAQQPRRVVGVHPMPRVGQVRHGVAQPLDLRLVAAAPAVKAPAQDHSSAQSLIAVVPSIQVFFSRSCHLSVRVNVSPAEGGALGANEGDGNAVLQLLLALA